MLYNEMGVSDLIYTLYIYVIEKSSASPASQEEMKS